MSESTLQYTTTTTPSTNRRFQTNVNCVDHLPNLPNSSSAMKGNREPWRCSLSKLYSAKTVFFYREGDVYFTGLRVPVSKAKYRTIDSLLEDLNSNMNMPFGVRHLTTPRGRTTIRTLDDLQHLGRYIASSSKSTHPINIDIIEKIQKARKENLMKQRNPENHFLGNNDNSNKVKRNKSKATCSYLSKSAKQVIFVLCGKSNHTYRMVFNTQRLKTFDAVLTEVSEGLKMAIFKLYTSSGKRLNSVVDLMKESLVVAVPRHKRFLENRLDDGKYTTRMQGRVEILSRLPDLTSNLTTKQIMGSRNHLTDFESDNSLESLINVKTGNKKSSNSFSQHSIKKREPCKTNADLFGKNINSKKSKIHSGYGINEERAAVAIQSAWRGYMIRKKFIKCRNRNHKEWTDRLIDNTSKVPYMNKKRAALIIQNAWRNYSRRLYKQPGELLRNNSVDTIQNPNVSFVNNSEKSVDVDDLNSVEENEILYSSDNIETPARNISNEPEEEFEKPKVDQYITYTVSVVTGNRWAADTNQDLYIILYGDVNKTNKHFLRQDPMDQKFFQNTMDSFQIETKHLGSLEMIVIGHERVGYGAGIFIERVLVTENISYGRQFLFHCGKWLDSGQVDGKIERTLWITAFYYISSIPDGSVQTKGRWELIFHSGKSDGIGGTTSNLNIVGCGVKGCSMIPKLYDSNLAKVPSSSLIQVDFGYIGELLKVRIEIDGSGDSPNYYLHHVELKDLDTEERMVCFVRRWLNIAVGDQNNLQPYREFVVYRAAFEPLNVIRYEGKMKITNYQCIRSDIVFIKIFGELGETGRFPVKLESESKHGKKQISFKTEAVSVGRIQCARIYLEPTPLGEVIYEGMKLLQTIFDNRSIPSINIGSEWLVDTVYIRESPHTPYRFVLGYNRVKDTQEEGNIFKELVLSGIEGLSTKISKKKTRLYKPSKWILKIFIGENSTLVPKVTLCSEKLNAEMTIMNRNPSDGAVIFKQNSVDIKTVIKIRIAICGTERLIKDITKDVNQKTVDLLNVKRMVLHDDANGDELRFLNINTIMEADSLYEYAAIWPDMPPVSHVRYEITVTSTQSSSNFNVYLNLIGARGDTGFRKLCNKNDQPIVADMVFIAEINAVSLGDLSTADIVLRSKKQPIEWICEEIQVFDTGTGLYYCFKPDKPFSQSVKSQKLQALSLPGVTSE